MTLNTLSNSKLAALAYRQGRVAALLKRLEDTKKELRGELFEFADGSYSGKDWMRPTTTVVVPKAWMDATDIALPTFIETRYPAWEILDQKNEEDRFILILRKKLEYMPWEYEDEDASVSRSISESTPTIDWGAMRKADPDLLMKIGTPVIQYELDEEALQELVANDPASVERLKLYTVSKKPVQRVLAKIKNDGRKKGA